MPFTAEIVAQFKYTVLIMPSGVNLVTGLDFAPEQYQSEHSITDAELKVGSIPTKLISSVLNARQSAWTVNTKQCGLSSCDNNHEMPRILGSGTNVDNKRVVLRIRASDILLFKHLETYDITRVESEIHKSYPVAFLTRFLT